MLPKEAQELKCLLHCHISDLHATSFPSLDCGGGWGGDVKVTLVFRKLCEVDLLAL